MKKIIGFGLLLPLLVITMSAAPSEAASNEKCTVASVWFQGGNGGGNGGAELLDVGCSDGNHYTLYVGTPGGCYSDAQGVKAMEAIALTAKVTGSQLNIWYSTMSCPGNSTTNVPNGWNI
jgi:hypothetical protein